MCVFIAIKPTIIILTSLYLYKHFCACTRTKIVELRQLVVLRALALARSQDQREVHLALQREHVEERERNRGLLVASSTTQQISAKRLGALQLNGEGVVVICGLLQGQHACTCARTHKYARTQPCTQTHAYVMNVHIHTTSHTDCVHS